MKRIGGAPSASARRWARAAPPSAASRAGARRATCATSGSTSTSRRCSTSPAPAATIADTERGFGATAARVAATAVPFAEALQAGGVAATAKHFPGPRRGDARTPTSPCSGSASRRRRCARVDEAPYRRFVAAGGDMVMLEHGDLPGLLAGAGRLLAVDRDRRAARAGSASRASRSPMPSKPSRCDAFGGPAKAGARRRARRHRPAALHRPRRRLGGPARPWSGSCARGTLDRGEFEASATTGSLDLRGRLGYLGRPARPPATPRGTARRGCGGGASARRSPAPPAGLASPRARTRSGPPCGSRGRRRRGRPAGRRWNSRNISAVQRPSPRTATISSITSSSPSSLEAVELELAVRARGRRGRGRTRPCGRRARRRAGRLRSASSSCSGEGVLPSKTSSTRR